MRDRERGQRDVVGQEDQPLRRLGIDVAHAAQRCGIVAARLARSQAHGVIRAQAGGELDGTRRAASKPNATLRARDEEGRFIREAMQAFEIDVAAVHDVDGPGLEHQIVEERHIRAFSFGNLHNRGDRAPKVHLRVQLDGRVMTSIACPRKDGETEVNDRGIERVDGVRQVHAEWIVDVQLARGANEALGEVRIDAPVTRLVRVGERRARDTRANAHVIELGLHGAEARFDITQALAIRELRERHAEKLIPAREARDFVIPAVSRDACPDRAL